MSPTTPLPLPLPALLLPLLLPTLLLPLLLPELPLPLPFPTLPLPLLLPGPAWAGGMIAEAAASVPKMRATLTHFCTGLMSAS
ncbi:MAG: hypothetical protein EOP22_14640 [Hyphomicrobiales bacterium]|nr:MAG: hypothetical protein EOP22_14640 [Hyphomicrobiales bacterium]